jgi:16S rRNA processing protein RimM
MSSSGGVTPPDPPLLAVGRISRAHGVYGEVAVRSLTERPQRFENGASLRLEDGRSLTVERTRSHQHRLLVKFEEVPDRTAAEALRGEVLLAPPAEEDPAEGWWVHEVVGIEVATEDGRELGRVREVLANPANDVWITDRGAMIPAVRDVVLDVDLGGRRALIRALPGLVNEDET